MQIYFDDSDTDIIMRGQATMRSALAEAGAEPDESWCIGLEKEFPDLVIEIRSDDFNALVSERSGGRGFRVTGNRACGEAGITIGEQRTDESAALGTGGSGDGNELGHG